MMNIKVGMMPGKLVEVVVEQGSTAREIFEIANIELGNHEIRLDGEKIDLDTTINNGKLLVAMKMIKGNMPNIKVGMMPGRLEVVEYTEGETAYEIFERVNIGLSNHEIRLDGDKITIDTRISNGNLLVAMKLIKGNSDVYVTDCTKEEVQMLLGVELPLEINKSNVQDAIGDFLEITNNNNFVIVERDMFYSVYTLKQEEVIENINNEIQEEQICICKDKKAMEVLNNELEQLEKNYNFYLEKSHEIQDKILFLTRLISEINA